MAQVSSTGAGAEAIVLDGRSEGRSEKDWNCEIITCLIPDFDSRST